MNAVFQWLDEHYQQMERSLLELLAIPSTEGSPSAGQPFGQGPAKALEYCLELGRKQGFNISNMDGYMGAIDYPGKVDEQIGILCHVDVVTANEEDWTSPPFYPTVTDGKIIARGAMDNKGPLIACQYAMLALKENDIVPTRSIRHLIGTNEETGFGCIDYFLKNATSLPYVGFAPDAKFPIVMGEKGLLRWTISGKWGVDDQDSSSLKFLHVKGGVGINSVPPSAQAIFEATDEGVQHIQALIQKYTSTTQQDIEVDFDGEQVRVTAFGRAVHAAYPQSGENAILKLLGLLKKLEFSPISARHFLVETAMRFSSFTEHSGEGFEDFDSYSECTNVLSLIDVSPFGGTFSCDTRYPVTHQASDYTSLLSRFAQRERVHLDIWSDLPPMFSPSDTPLIVSLQTLFEEFTDIKHPPFVIGTGSYARKLPNFAAFGPLFPHEENIFHQVDEWISKERLLFLSKIYAAAIVRLANSNDL